MKISEVIDKKIVETPFDDFKFDLQDKLQDMTGRPKIIPIGKSGLKAVYHKQSNSFIYWGGENDGEPVTGKVLRNIWNQLDVGIGGSEAGKIAKQKRDPFQRMQAWWAGTGKGDTARATRLDPTASKMKKLAVAGMMKVFGPNKMPGKIPLSDQTLAMLQNYVNAGLQKKMATAFNDAIKIGQQVGATNQIGTGGSANKVRDDELLKMVTAKYNELLAGSPSLEKLIIHLANTGEFVPALNWVKDAKPMTTNLLPNQQPKKLPAPDPTIHINKKGKPVPNPKNTPSSKRDAKGQYMPGNQSGVQFDSKDPG